MPELYDQIVVSERGVFIPREFFGQRAQILNVLDRLGAFSASQEPKASATFKRVELPDCSRELQWINEHREEYLGQWVALSGDLLISHGNDAREVANAARTAGIETPFLAQVDPIEELPFGGW